MCSHEPLLRSSILQLWDDLGDNLCTENCHYCLETCTFTFSFRRNFLCNFLIYPCVKVRTVYMACLTRRPFRTSFPIVMAWGVRWWNSATQWAQQTQRNRKYRIKLLTEMDKKKFFHMFKGYRASLKTLHTSQEGSFRYVLLWWPIA